MDIHRMLLVLLVFLVIVDSPVLVLQVLVDIRVSLVIQVQYKVLPVLVGIQDSQE